MLRIILTVPLLCACSTSDVTPKDAAPNLVEYPAAPAPPDGGYPSCVPSGIAEAGPCCTNFYCLELREGGACPSAGSSEVSYGAGLAGGCTCGVANGPYENPDGDVVGCCYVLSREVCQ